MVCVLNLRIQAVEKEGSQDSSWPELQKEPLFEKQNRRQELGRVRMNKLCFMVFEETPKTVVLSGLWEKVIHAVGFALSGGWNHVVSSVWSVKSQGPCCFLPANWCGTEMSPVQGYTLCSIYLPCVWWVTKDTFYGSEVHGGNILYPIPFTLLCPAFQCVPNTLEYECTAFGDSAPNNSIFHR